MIDSLDSMIDAVRRSPARLDGRARAAILDRILDADDGPRFVGPAIIPIRRAWPRTLALGAVGLAAAAAAALIVLWLAPDRQPATRPPPVEAVRAPRERVLAPAAPPQPPAPSNLPVRQRPPKKPSRWAPPSPPPPPPPPPPSTPAPPATPASSAVPATPPTPPPAPAKPVAVAPTALALRRLTGDPDLRPTPVTAARMYRRSDSSVRITIKFCIDTRGVVTGAQVLGRKSHYPEYERELVAGVRTWTYRPWVVNGQPRPACSTVMFSFSQR